MNKHDTFKLWNPAYDVTGNMMPIWRFKLWMNVQTQLQVMMIESQMRYRALKNNK